MGRRRSLCQPLVLRPEPQTGFSHVTSLGPEMPEAR